MRVLLNTMVIWLIGSQLLGCLGRSQGAPMRPYPENLTQQGVVDIQVFRDGTKITLVNASATTFSDFSLWLNRRFVREVALLPAGGRLTLSLFDFRDEYGEVFRGGGFFAGYEPDPVVLAQLQIEDGELIGLIVIPDSLSD